MAVSGVSVSAPSTANSAAAARTNKTGAAVSDKSQLNLASSVLTQDVIDGLKDADESVQVKPLANRIEQNNTKQGDLTALTTLISQFKTSFADVANENALLKRSVTAAGSGSVTASVEAGVNEQTIRLSVEQLAKADSFQSKGFDSRSAVLDSTITGEQTLTMKVGDKSFDLKITNTTTLEDINDQINSSDIGLKSSIINTGGENGQRLVFQTKETGANQAISFSGGADGVSILKKLGFNATDDGSGNITLADGASGEGKRLQTAQDAKFTFNDIEITRSSNSVDDLIIGVTFNLNNVDEVNATTGRKESVITIGRDTSAVVDSLKNMVQAYNDLMSNVSTATSYNKDTGAAGSLNGMSEITGIKRTLSNIMNGTYNGISLQDFGFSFSEKGGVISLDESKLNEAMNKDYDKFKEFFTASTGYKNANVFSSGAITGNTLDGGLSGKLKINGKEIDINLTDASGIKNATDLVKLINDAGIEDVKASIAENGRLQISGSMGINVQIDGDAGVLTKLGLSKGTTLGSKTENKGFFGTLNDAVKGLIGTSGTLTNLADSLKNKNELLVDQKTKIQTQLDKKYATMQNQFATIAVQMNSLENSFKTLQSTFEAMLGNNDN